MDVRDFSTLILAGRRGPRGCAGRRAAGRRTARCCPWRACRCSCAWCGPCARPGCSACTSASTRRSCSTHEPELAALRRAGELQLHASETSPSRSVAAALAPDAMLPCLVTTADHALLTPAMIQHFLGRGLRIGCGPADRHGRRRRSCRPQHPETQRTYLRLRGEAWSGANLFAFRTPRARRVADFYVRAERFRKQPWRLVAAIGPSLLLALRAAPARPRRARSRAARAPRRARARGAHAAGRGRDRRRPRGRPGAGGADPAQAPKARAASRRRARGRRSDPAPLELPRPRPRRGSGRSPDRSPRTRSESRGRRPALDVDQVVLRALLGLRAAVGGRARAQHRDRALRTRERVEARAVQMAVQHQLGAGARQHARTAPARPTARGAPTPRPAPARGAPARRARGRARATRPAPARAARAARRRASRPPGSGSVGCAEQSPTSASGPRTRTLGKPLAPGRGAPLRRPARSHSRHRSQRAFARHRDVGVVVARHRR